RLFSTANSFFLPKPVAQKPQSSNTNANLFFLRLQLLRRLFFFFLFPFFFPPSCFFRRLHPGESGADARAGPNYSVRSAGSSALGCRGVRLRGRLRGGRGRRPLFGRSRLFLGRGDRLPLR